MKSILQKILFISLLFSAVVPATMQASWLSWVSKDTAKKIIEGIKSFSKDHPFMVGGTIVATLGLLKLYKSRSKEKPDGFKELPDDQKLPIVYHEGYNIGFFGLENFHPFDSKKYRKIYKYLVENAGIHKNRFYAPKEVADEELRKVHSKEYLTKLRDSASATFAWISEIPPVWLLPNFITREKALKPMRLATGGTVKATELARKHGWAINLSGGYHHAKRDEGSGFCAYADIPLAAHNVLEKNPNAKIMIVDLDAHQGNGHEAILGPDKRVTIFDVYNGTIYPQDHQVKRYIKFDYPVKSHIQDNAYLKIISEKLPEAIDTVNPDLIIYNAGTDIFEKDPLGQMGISKDGIKKRDEFVFNQALSKKIPIVMVLSGGYTKESGGIIGKSIENLIKNVIPRYKPKVKQHIS
ncbi:MAG TPA: histone deacetylase [Candidatus Dependentiae bacterium]|nr:histone deacetylase [Candidatus Dependentiae bacterium]